MVESYITVWVFHASFFHSFLEDDNFWYQIFPESCVAIIYDGVVGSLITILLQNSFKKSASQKILKNRLRFDRVITKSLVSPFFETQCIQHTSHTCMHACTFNGPLFGSTHVSQYYYYYYYYYHLTASFPGQPGWASTRKVKPIWTLLKQETEWQWHQLGYVQGCTLLQTDNHASTLPLSFYRMDDLPVTQPTLSKHCIQCIQ